MPAVPMQDRGDLEDRCKEVSPRETPGSLTYLLSPLCCMLLLSKLGEKALPQDLTRGASP